LTGIVLALRGRLWREALAAVLCQQGDLRILAQPERLDDIRHAVQRTRPDLVVLDAELPGNAAVHEVCSAVCQRTDVRILIITERWDGAHTELARLAPRVGFLAPEASAAQLVDGVRALARGEPVLDVGLAVAALTAGTSPLTDRERDVLARSVGGAPAKAIATELCLSVGTVRNYLSRAVAKTGARSRFEAVQIARDEGWI
jgi:two-component system response regulator DesR